jgi:hypothetical protein
VLTYPNRAPTEVPTDAPTDAPTNIPTDQCEGVFGLGLPPSLTWNDGN